MKQNHGDPEAYALVKLLFKLKASQRDALDTSYCYDATLEAAAVKDWFTCGRTLLSAGIIDKAQYRNAITYI